MNPSKLAESLRRLVSRGWEFCWQTDDYWLTRFFILRLTGLVYAVAFLVIINQGLPLLGENGLLPVPDYLSRIFRYYGGIDGALLNKPTIFLGFYSDTFFLALAWVGFLLSLLVLAGLDNALIFFLLWGLYLSFVNVGQIWYGYGWETQLLETGFLAIFFTSFLDPRPFSGPAPPRPIIWLYRWLALRIMLGSGLIKLRGDSCWWDLTCLQFHFETQPLPNPLSWYFHYLPDLMLQAGVLFNHLAEVVAPFAVFGPGVLRVLSGGIMAVFQVILILSGNLSFLNWLTLIPILACFRDRHFRWLLPSQWAEHVKSLADKTTPIKTSHRVKTAGFVIVVLFLSINPARNLFSEQQRMNAAFSPFKIVNTYGAFGTVGRKRPELVVKGTRDPVIHSETEWKTYTFKAKPTNPSREPPWISPYHYRLDWQIWFAAMSSPRRTPWIFRFVQKLLQNDRSVIGLLRNNPFPEKGPRFIKIDRYRYEFEPPATGSEQTWRRRKIETWLPPLSLDHERFRKILRSRGWLTK